MKRRKKRKTKKEIIKELKWWWIFWRICRDVKKYLLLLQEQLLCDCNNSYSWNIWQANSLWMLNYLLLVFLLYVVWISCSTVQFITNNQCELYPLRSLEQCVSEETNCESRFDSVIVLVTLPESLLPDSVYVIEISCEQVNLNIRENVFN